MSEENKQDDFLSGHEELLNNINKKKDEHAEPAETPVEEVVEASEEVVAEETPVEKEVVVEEAVIVAEEASPEVVEEEVEVLIEKPVAEVPPVVKDVPVKEPKPKKKPATPAEAKKQKKQTLQNSEVKEVLNFINKYVKPAATALVIICALVLFNSFMKTGRLKKEAAADQALMDARSADDYQAILNNYGKTPSAPLAMIALAGEKFNKGQTAEAEALYTEFIKKNPKHEMAIQAEYNLITCVEAQGRYGEAHTLYGVFKTDNPDSYLAPQALLGKARCLEATDNFAEARAVYEDIIAFYPESGWARMAESQRRVVEAKLK